MAMITYAKCCTVFSVTGIIFLVVLGILLQKQPVYVKGIEDPVSGAISCYNGAAIYAAFFVVSIVYWMFDDMKNERGFFAKKVDERLSSGPPAQKMKFGSTYGALSTGGGK